MKINVTSARTHSCQDSVGLREFADFDEAIRTLRSETGEHEFEIHFYDHDDEYLDMKKDIPEIEIMN